MHKKTIKKAGQNLTEYAVLISLVIGAVVAMQVYTKRALQARIHDAGLSMTSQPIGLQPGTPQYEPQYLTSHYDITRDSKATSKLTGGPDMAAKGGGADDHTLKATDDIRVTRGSGGFQKSSYNPDDPEVIPIDDPVINWAKGVFEEED